MKSKLYLASVVLSLLVILSFAEGAPADGLATIEGQVMNGSSIGDVPIGLVVTLHVFNTEGALETKTTTTDAEGNFYFVDISSDLIQAYVVTIMYKGVTYSQDLSLPLKQTPLFFEIFETTNDIRTLTVDSHVWLIKSVGSNRREIIALEIVLITNNDVRTFQPDLEDPSKMNFLRFSLPPEAHSLEVQADFLGGSVIDVGTGFGMTAPILPGSHQIVFTYILPYSGSTLDMIRNFPQGSGTFRALLPDHLGRLHGERLEALEESALIGGVNYNVWEADAVESGAGLKITLSALPEPTVWQKVKSSVGAEGFLQVLIPTLLGISLSGMIIYSVMRQRHSRRSTKSRDEPSILSLASVESLLEDVAVLDNLFEDCMISEKTYREQRLVLKARITVILTSKAGTFERDGSE